VLVVGAGIGGLAVARALSSDGHDVSVFEQASGLREGGAAVTLWSNGTGILAELGVTLDGAGSNIDVLEQRDFKGNLLLSVDVARSAKHFGHPHICLPRTTLLERVADGLPEGMIRFSHACDHVSQQDEEIRATFVAEGSESGDLLIGADGRNSVVRNYVWDGDPANLSGWATWQGVTPIDTEVTRLSTGVMFVGPAGLCGLMPAGGGLLQWWFDERWSPDTAEPVSKIADLRQKFGQWAEPVRHVLDVVEDADIGFFPHYRHKVPRVWSKGAVTLMGDAVHSMPPTRAQGANQALEDAFSLSRALRDRDVTAALRAYEQSRAPKAAYVSKSAGREDTNEYRPLMLKLIPNGLASRFYTTFLKRVSNYLN
jgi:FAD-dependent urate hydroxylase